MHAEVPAALMSVAMASSISVVLGSVRGALDLRRKRRAVQTVCWARSDRKGMVLGLRRSLGGRWGWRSGAGPAQVVGSAQWRRVV